MDSLLKRWWDEEEESDDDDLFVVLQLRFAMIRGLRECGVRRIYGTSCRLVSSFTT